LVAHDNNDNNRRYRKKKRKGAVRRIGIIGLLSVKVPVKLKFYRNPAPAKLKFYRSPVD
jgi:hypothetical protein